jgi:PBP1b-binding outer membrane lipoprotein LpoB
MMRRILGIGIVVTLAIILTACSNSEKDKSKPQKPPVEEKINDKEKETQPKTNLPLTKNIEVEIEGMKEQRSAELMQSAIGYHFYMLDLYNFEKENDTTGKIVFANEPSLYATIEKLDQSADIEGLKKSSMNRAEEQTGTANELAATDIYFPYFHDAKFFVKGISEQHDVIMYLVKEVEGELFYFSLHIPSKAEMEGVEPSLWAMLETVKPDEK